MSQRRKKVTKLFYKHRKCIREISPIQKAVCKLIGTTASSLYSVTVSSGKGLELRRHSWGSMRQGNSFVTGHNAEETPWVLPKQVSTAQYCVGFHVHVVITAKCWFCNTHLLKLEQELTGRIFKEVLCVLRLLIHLPWVWVAI